MEAVQLHLCHHDGRVREPDVRPSGKVGRGERVEGDGDSRIAVFADGRSCSLLPITSWVNSLLGHIGSTPHSILSV